MASGKKLPERQIVVVRKRAEYVGRVHARDTAEAIKVPGRRQDRSKGIVSQPATLVAAK